MKTYVVVRSGEEIGVFTTSELKQKTDTGELVPTDEMRQSGTTEWIQLGSVPGFFEQSNVLLTPEDPLLEDDKSFGLSPDSSDLSGTGMEISSDESGGSTCSDTFDDNDIEDDDVDEESITDSLPKKDPEQAQSELARATIFATKNYLRRSIFINQADKIQKYGYVLQCVGIIILGLFAYPYLC